MHTLRKLFFVCLFVFGVVIAPVSVHAALTETQIQSIISLVRSFGAESKIIENLETALRNPPASPTPSTASLRLSATPAFGSAPLTTTFTSQAAGTLGTFMLSFGDGQPSVPLSFCPSSVTGCVGPLLTTHTYQNPGTYVASLSNPAGVVIKNQIVYVSRLLATSTPSQTPPAHEEDEDEDDHNHETSSDPDSSYTPDSLVSERWRDNIGSATPIASSTNPHVQRFTTTAGPLAIYPIEQATMRLDFNGAQVCVDPGKWGTIGTPCDLILFTHGHGDHFTIEATRAVVKADTKIITTQNVYNELAELKSKATVMSSGSTTFRSIGIEIVPAYNNTGLIKWHKKGCCNGYILTYGDYRLYIPGDTDATPELLAVTDIDIMFVALWPPFTMRLDEAVAAVKQIKPRIAFPFHYGQESKLIRKGDDPHVFATKVRATAGNVTEVRDNVDWYWQRGF